MQPLNKTFRASKVHDARDCGTCAEDVRENRSAVRHEAHEAALDEADEHLNHDLLFHEPEYCVHCLSVGDSWPDDSEGDW